MQDDSDLNNGTRPVDVTSGSWKRVAWMLRSLKGILTPLLLITLIVTIAHSQQHYALSKKTLARNMSFCLQIAAEHAEGIAAYVHTDDDRLRGNLAGVHRIYAFLNEFTRHQRTYATLHLKETQIPELADIIRSYGNLILVNGGKGIGAQPGSEERKQLAMLLDVLCEDLRIMAETLDVLTILSWKNVHDASDSIKTLALRLKLYEGKTQSPLSIEGGGVLKSPSS